MRKYVCLMLLVLTTLSLHSEEDWIPGDVVAVPAVFYTPDTGVGFGAFGIWSRDASEDCLQLENDAFARDLSNNLQLAAIYTTNNQVSTTILYQFYWRCLYVDTDLSVALWPSEYYGRGPFSRVYQIQEFEAEQFKFVLGLLHRFGEGVSFGPRMRFVHHAIAEADEGGTIDLGLEPGSEGYDGVGLGCQLRIERRDNDFLPREGWFLEGRYSAYRRLWGSDSNYEYIMVDARYYQPIGEKSVLGFHLLSQNAWGGVPFQDLSILGSDSILRGFPEDRYRDHSSLSGQVEFRFPVWWRFGMVLFAGAGNVAPSFERLSLDGIKLGGGVGFRYLFAPERGINLRVDIAMNNDTTEYDTDDHETSQIQFYIRALEAF